MPGVFAVLIVASGLVYTIGGSNSYRDRKRALGTVAQLEEDMVISVGLEKEPLVIVRGA